MQPAGLLILAAGASTRLGRPKQLALWRGKTLLRHAVDQALGSACRPIVVVLGAQGARIEPHLHGLAVHVAHNGRWENGMSTSLRVGLDALCQQAPALPALVVTLCDQPFVTATVLDTLVETHQTSGAPLVASGYNDTSGVPCLFARTLFPEINALEGAEGARRLFTRHASDLITVPFPGGAIDIDTPDDYARLTED